MPKLVLKSADGEGQAIDLPAGRHVFGRGAESDFQLEHPSVAERHCEIEVTGDEMIVRDLGSMSGTYVNGEFAGGAKVKSQQTLRIGDLEFVVEGAPVKVIVPETAGPAKVWQREMPGGWWSCAKHHSERGVGECEKCHRIWCPHCLHRIGLQGRKPLLLCPECGGMCGPVKRKVQAVRRGFWSRLFYFLFGWLVGKPRRKVVVRKAAPAETHPPSKLKIKKK